MNPLQFQGVILRCTESSQWKSDHKMLEPFLCLVFLALLTILSITLALLNCRLRGDESGPPLPNGYDLSLAAVVCHAVQ